MQGTSNVSAKPTRRYPLASLVAILALITLVGVYIFSLSLKQNGMVFGLKQTNMVEKEREQPCHNSNVPETEMLYVHYPSPHTYSREECACTPVRFFAILSMRMSGSGWFETLLNSHENISSNGEIFCVKERRSNITATTRTLDKLYNLDWISSAAKNECTAVVGLKWMLNQGLMKHDQEIAEYFNQKGVSVIFLLRRNPLQRYVSILANDHDRNYKKLNGTHKVHLHYRDQADVLAQYRPTIDTKSLIAELKRTDKLATDALVSFKKIRNIVLYYEDVVSNRTKITDVLDFLKLPKTKLSSRHVKIHTKRLHDHIDNWTDVYNTLNGTQYESFLNGRK
uniref:Uncharacterized protein n=1 Tax=Avena sativa TaxID=4498 RepID=A0ACD5ZA61_AVESA